MVFNVDTGNIRSKPMSDRRIFYYGTLALGACCEDGARGCGLSDLHGLAADTLAQIAAGAGFSGSALPIAVAIALAESGGNPNAHCLNCLGVREDSRGLWQINVNAHPEYAGANLYDPSTNGAAAYAVSSGGSNFRPWSTYKSGAYRSFLQSVSVAPVSPAPVSPAGDSEDGASAPGTADAPMSPAFFGLSPLALGGLAVGAYFLLK